MNKIPEIERTDVPFNENQFAMVLTIGLDKETYRATIWENDKKNGFQVSQVPLELLPKIYAALAESFAEARILQASIETLKKLENLLTD